MALLAVTLVLAVGLSVCMWVVGAVPFDAYTSALHVVSIYIGIAAVVLWQGRFGR